MFALIITILISNQLLVLVLKMLLDLENQTLLFETLESSALNDNLKLGHWLDAHHIQKNQTR